jgi:membrane protein
MGVAVSVMKETVFEWWGHEAARLAAALSYYTAFAVAPLLILVIAMVGAIFGEEAVRGQIQRELSSLIGDQAAPLIEGMIAEAGSEEEEAGWASVLGILGLLFGATGVFVELQNALNRMWDVEPKPGRGIRGILATRAMGFAMVLGIGFVLLVSLAVSAAVAALTDRVAVFVGDEGMVAQVLTLFGSFVTTTILFAMIFKYLPDAEIRWRDVWVGAAATSLLFSIGKWAIGLYLGRSALASTYGAAAALAVFLVWIYYSAQILFLGAEFTRVYARHFGGRIVPSPHAVHAGAH